MHSLFPGNVAGPQVPVSFGVKRGHATMLQLIESDTCLSGAELGERGWVFSLSSLEPAGTSTMQMISSQRMAEPQEGRNLGP